MAKLIVFLFFLVACTTASPSEEALPTPVPTAPLLPASPTAVAEPVLPTAVPTETLPPTATVAKPSFTPSPSATESPTPTATAETAVSQVVSGRTEDGAFFLGAADAPVTMIDYSDFL